MQIRLLVFLMLVSLMIAGCGMKAPIPSEIIF